LYKLNIFGKKAEACAAVALVPIQPIGGAIVGRGTKTPTDDNWGFEDERTQSLPYPIQSIDLSKFLGKNPEDYDFDTDGYSFPATASRLSKTETLVTQPGKSSNTYTFPNKLLLLPLLLFAYKANGIKGIGGGSESPLSNSERTYDHNYEKHKPKPGGQGALWAGASVNPIPDEFTGQRLLDSAFSSIKKQDQLFNYYDGKVIVFRSSNDGKWHSYAVNKNIVKLVGNDILKTFLKEGLIDKPEYNQLLKK
jgi:hypothetical protein